MEAVDNTTYTGGVNHSPNPEEMSLGTMVATGISCGILVCIMFSCFAEKWDYYITTKMSGRVIGQRNHIHDEGSSDLSDPAYGWESVSGDSSSNDSNIRVSVHQ